MMIFLNEYNLIRVQINGQQTTLAVCFQKKLVNKVGILTSLLSLAQQIG